jgi:hypothetical protein
MTHRSLAAARSRLEIAEAHLSRIEELTDPQAIYDRLESIAIAVLDSEHADWPAGLLEDYLRTLLRLRALELGLAAFHQTRQHD